MTDRARSNPLRHPPLLALPELFRAFVSMSLHGFGGVLPWARRAIVEEKRWMTAQEFNEAFAVSQFLPGANVVNLAIIFGGRLHGAAGAAVALAGLLLPPMAIVLTLGALYARYGDIDALQRVLAGVAAAAAGLIGAIVIKMAQPLLREGAAGARRRGGGLRRGRRHALAAALRAARAGAGLDRARRLGAAMKLDTLGHARRCISRCSRCSRSAAPWRWCRKCTGRRSRCRTG